MSRIKPALVLFMLLVFVIATTAQECDVNFINDALARSGENCRNTGRNQICFANQELEAQPVEGVDDFNFQNVGDIEDIINFSSLELSEFDPEDDSWGVAIMNAQANIPNTLPGQNVMFLLFGNVNFSVEGVDQETGLQAFSITTGIGRTTCNEVPQDGMIIQTNSREPVEFMLNDTQVRLGSTAFVTTSEEAITIGLFEGHSWITNLGVTQEMGAGSQIETPYDGVPRVKTDFVYYQDPALNNVWNWADSMYFTGQDCVAEVFERTFVRIAPDREAFRVVDDGTYTVIGKYRHNDQMAWEIERSEINGGLNAIQLWLVESLPSTFTVSGDCQNVEERTPNAPVVAPRQATQPSVVATHEYSEATQDAFIPYFASIEANPTNLSYSETSTVLEIRVAHARSAQLFVSYTNETINITINDQESAVYITLENIPTGEHFVNLIVEDLAGQIFEYYYSITRSDTD